MKFIVLLLLLFIALLFVVLCADITRTMMQPAAVTCDPAALIARANAMPTTGDVREDLFELNVLAFDVQRMNKACIQANYNLTPLPTPERPTPQPTATAVPGAFEVARR